MGDLELVDGSTLNPVPVIPVRSLAPELPVVAVALSAPMGVPERAWAFPLPEYIPRNLLGRLSRLRSTQALDVFLRSMGMITRAVTEYRLEVDKPDIILRPQVADIDILARVDIHQVAQIGEKSVEDALPELKKLFAWQNRFRRVIGV
jgi:NTE family protein